MLLETMNTHNCPGTDFSHSWSFCLRCSHVFGTPLSVGDCSLKIVSCCGSTTIDVIVYKKLEAGNNIEIIK